MSKSASSTPKEAENHREDSSESRWAPCADASREVSPHTILPLRGDARIQRWPPVDHPPGWRGLWDKRRPPPRLSGASQRLVGDTLPEPSPSAHLHPRSMIQYCRNVKVRRRHALWQSNPNAKGARRHRQRGVTLEETMACANSSWADLPGPHVGFRHQPPRPTWCRSHMASGTPSGLLQQCRRCPPRPFA